MSYQLNEIPNSINASNVIARLVDGLLYRYFWATKDLTLNDFKFRPTEDSMSIEELNLHIYDLAFIANKTYGGNPVYKKDNLKNFDQARNEIIELYEQLSLHLKQITNDQDLNNYTVSPKSIKGEFPFWFTLNGHLADCLTHIGQITSWRRINGNPIPKETNVFLGK